MQPATARVRNSLPGLLTAAAGLLHVFLSGAAFAISNAPYSEFKNLQLQDLSAVQLKLTPRFTPLWDSPSVVLGGPSTSPNVQDFWPHRDRRFKYTADRAFLPLTASVPAGTMRAMLDSVASLPTVVDTIADQGPALSFTLLRSDGERPRYFEALVSLPDAVRLLGRLHGALGGAPSADSALRAFACANRFLSADLPEEVTRQVSIRTEHVRSDARTGEFLVQVVVTNDSRRPLEAPLYLLVRFDGPRVRLVNAAGTTCQLPNFGAPFVVLPVTKSLGSHQSVGTTLRVGDPDRSGPGFTGRVFSGSGDP